MNTSVCKLQHCVDLPTEYATEADEPISLPKFFRRYPMLTGWITFAGIVRPREGTAIVKTSRHRYPSIAKDF